jgi:predicted O-linked N-acetylglucosamine transferase (SPINDLY family)
LEEAFHAEPENCDGRIMLGEVLVRSGRPKDALSVLDGLEQAGGNCEALRVLGEAAFAIGDREKAADHFEKACTLNSDSVILHHWCAVLGISLSRFDAAVSHWRLIIALKPDDRNSLCGLASALWSAGEMEECLNVSRRARETFPEDEQAHVNWLRAVDHTSFDPRESRTVWEEWAQHSLPEGAPADDAEDREWEPDKVLRIGYLIDEIHKRPNSYFIPPLLENHNRDSFNVALYLTAPRASDEWEKLSSMEQTARDMRTSSIEEIAEQVRQDGIDVLVNVSWEFRNRNIAVFGHRAAPIQIELPHYPATTGHPETDFILSDKWICPPGHEDMYTERVCRLDQSYMPWVLPETAPAVSVLPCLTSGQTTFGIFQKPSKFNSIMWDSVAEILSRVTSARLLIHNNSSDLDQPSSGLRHRYEDELLRRNISPNRVRYIGVRNYAEHFQAIAQCDIALDTFPYNGTTTTGDCLWMGVPVITLAGKTHSGRVGLSMLSRVGLEDFVAETNAGYIELAVKMAADTERLENLRKGLRRRMEESPLTKASAVMFGLEREFRSLWRARCKERLTNKLRR